MAVTESLALVGDSRGHLVLLDADLATSPSGPSLALITRTQPPTRERVPLLSVQVLPPTDVANESTVLTYQVRPPPSMRSMPIPNCTRHGGHGHASIGCTPL